MANSRQITLPIREPKSNAVKASAGAADGTVIVEYDRELPQADVIASLEMIRQVIIDSEYNTDV